MSLLGLEVQPRRLRLMLSDNDRDLPFGRPSFFLPLSTPGCRGPGPLLLAPFDQTSQRSSAFRRSECCERVAFIDSPTAGVPAGTCASATHKIRELNMLGLSFPVVVNQSSPVNVCREFTSVMASFR